MLSTLQKMEQLNQLICDIELAVERGKAQQLRDRERGSHGNANAMEGAEHLLQATSPNVSPPLEGQTSSDHIDVLRRPFARAVDVLKCA